MSEAIRSGTPEVIHRIAFTAVAAVIGLAMLVTTGASPAVASTAPAWSITSSPNTSATQDNSLTGVSCTSPSACVAVGDFFDGTHDQTLIETWNGNAWTITSSPNTSATQDNEFNGVSCTSPTACVAVGQFSNGTHDQTLIETWNGTAWTITSSPNTSATQDNSLNSVACTSPSACVAVGQFSNGTHDQTLIETWNGTAWTITSSPNTSATQNNLLNGVSCTSPSACVAVGVFSNATNAQTLIETWNGNAWTITSSPNTSATQDNSLFGVSCTSPSACVAVGDFFDGTHDQTLIETWNGTAWTITSSPNTSATQNNLLFGVSCTSPSACVAVGDFFDGTDDQTLIETWNGTAWTITSSPNTSATQNNSLLGVSCTSPTACVAVGDIFNVTNAQTLALSAIGPGSYWLVASDGGIFNYGDAAFFGSTGSLSLNKPVVGMAATPDGLGYWLVASDGGIFNYGDAAFFGSTGSLSLNKPVVGMAATPDGKGYWLVASDGGIFNYGDAAFFGSTGSLSLNKPVVGMAATPDGKGYWLVASDGGIFNYGDAAFFGSTGSLSLNKPVVGMAATPDGKGYWLVASDGGIFNYGDAQFFGSTGAIHLNQPVVGMAADQTGKGYWLVASDGGIFNYGDAPFEGSTGGIHLNQPVVGMAG